MFLISNFCLCHCFNTTLDDIFLLAFHPIKIGVDEFLSFFCVLFLLRSQFTAHGERVQTKLRTR